MSMDRRIPIHYTISKWPGYRYVMLPICIFGVVCNLLNLSVLLQRRLKESPYTYLTGLALADMLTLIFISSLSIVRGDYIRT